MDLAPAERQRLLQRTARDLLEAECPVSLVRELEHSDQGYSNALWKKIADLGWLGLAVPPEFGGSGGSAIDQEILFEEVGRALVPGPLIASSVFATRILLIAGSREQKAALLPSISRGETIATSRLVQQGAGLRAEAKGESYVLSGTELFVPYAHSANYIVCQAHTAGDGRPPQGPSGPDAVTLFLVDTRSPGLRADLMESVGGYKQHEVTFEKVTVPRDAVLGWVGGGLDHLAGAKQWATVVQCGEMVGRSEKILELVVEYSKNRIQFGRPIGSFQAVQHRCADLRVAVDGTRLVTRQAAWKLSEGLPCAEDVSMAKAGAGALSRLAAAAGHHIFAGIAFTVEHDMQLYTARSKIAEVNMGDTDYHLGKLGAHMGL